MLTTDQVAAWERDGFLVLDLHADERVGIGLRGKVRHARAKAPPVGARPRGQTSPGTWPITEPRLQK